MTIVSEVVFAPLGEALAALVPFLSDVTAAAASSADPKAVSFIRGFGIFVVAFGIGVMILRAWRNRK